VTVNFYNLEVNLWSPAISFLLTMLLVLILSSASSVCVDRLAFFWKEGFRRKSLHLVPLISQFKGKNILCHLYWTQNQIKFWGFMPMHHPKWMV